MKVTINGSVRDCQGTTLEALLAEFGYGDMIVATAVNQRFVAAQGRVSYRLKHGDRVEVVAPMQGG